MIRRRTFGLPEGLGQVIVTFDDTTNEMIVGYRKEAWETWSRPVEQIAAEDDEPGRTNRGIALADPAALIEQMRSLVEAHDANVAASQPEVPTDFSAGGDLDPSVVPPETTTGPDQIDMPKK